LVQVVLPPPSPSEVRAALKEERRKKRRTKPDYIPVDFKAAATLAEGATPFNPKPLPAKARRSEPPVGPLSRSSAHTLPPLDTGSRKGLGFRVSMVGQHPCGEEPGA
jgi:hypothetical protein